MEIRNYTDFILFRGSQNSTPLLFHNISKNLSYYLNVYLLKHCNQSVDIIQFKSCNIQYIDTGMAKKLYPVYR